MPLHSYTDMSAAGLSVAASVRTGEVELAGGTENSADHTFASVLSATDKEFNLDHGLISSALRSVKWTDIRMRESNPKK